MPTRFYRRSQLVTCYKSIQDECCYKQIADCAYFSFSFTTAPRLTRLRLNVTHFLHSSLRTETVRRLRKHRAGLSAIAGLSCLLTRLNALTDLHTVGLHSVDYQANSDLCLYC